jgi:hypothetical protein
MAMRSLMVSAMVMCLAASVLRAAEPAVDFFEKKVRPVLVTHCYQCHSDKGKAPKGGLRVDGRAALLQGGDSGPALVPGRPEQSKLIEALSYRNIDLRMPPKGKLPDAVVADLTTWVQQGAIWPAGTGTTAQAKNEAFDLNKRRREHWAWQPIKVVPVPKVHDKGWSLSDVDRFLLQRLEAAKLSPASATDRGTLLRRLSFDLIGLPPTPGELSAFLSDDRPGALERVVDRLLASPHFGERWARHWLDLVRYAESRGHEFDYTIPNAWQYRDYVIRALNADVPYRQFVLEHIAGDLLPEPRRHPVHGFNESVLGTGFWFLGEEVHSPVDIRDDETDRTDNKIDVLGKTFLAMTVSCARCHDHKFDAISTQDYYALSGFLLGCDYRQVRFETVADEQPAAEQLQALRERWRGDLQRLTAEAMRPGLNRLAQTLLAARTVLKAGPAANSGTSTSNGHDPRQISAWVDALRQAAKDADDPFHVFAQDGLKPTAEVRRGDVRVLADAAQMKSWAQDGRTFSLCQPGDPLYGATASQPLTGLCRRVSAQRDGVWDRLSLATDNEKEATRLQQRQPAGRLLRTPKVTLGSGRVYYLVKGSGHAYAVVDSHRINNGPLHAALIREWKGDNGYRWIEQNLSAYRGHRVAIEFCPLTPDRLKPGESADLAVALVVETEQSPGPATPLNQRVTKMATEHRGPEALAQAYQALFLEIANRLAEGHVTNSDDCHLADWLVRHIDLIAPTNSPERQQLAERAQPFVAEQERILAAVRRPSHTAPAMLDGNGLDERVLIRGNSRMLGTAAPRRFLQALAGPEALTTTSGSGRLELARQLTDVEKNPLLARVMVNRVWHHLFGRGLVASTDNFGVLGERPTHPELLDYLADRLVRNGWSVKSLIRYLVMTQAYRMTSNPEPASDEADPQNLLLHRMRMRRLDGEAVRDALLVVSGRLDPKLGGPSVPVALTDFLMGRGRPASGPLDGYGRRSIYTAVRRNFLSPFLLAFDAPIPFSAVGRRTVSNVPAQALILMNDPLVHQQADLWAQRVLASTGDMRQHIGTMYLGAFARPVSERELAMCLDFLAGQSQLHGTGTESPAAWADLAHALINVKEFIFLP